MDEDHSIIDKFIQGSNGELTSNLEDKKPLVIRGITKKKAIKESEKNNKDYFYIDTGYFGNFPSPGNPGGKKKYHRIVKNNLQHLKIENYPSDRWEKLIFDDPRLKWSGWKQFNKKILLVAPNPKACNFYDIDCDNWINETITAIKHQTNLPIEIRVKGSRSYRNHEYSIYDAFKSGVYATICFNSIAALESVLYGIPAFVTVPCAASPLASSDIYKLNDPFFPDLKTIESHCYGLAYGQFTVEEMSNGFAWKILQK